MTFKDLAKRISTCYNSLPALIDALRDGFNEIEGGGSSAHNYSTEEQKIGKWIDGKPIYQKTSSLGAISAGTSPSLLVGIGANVVDTLIACNVIATVPSGAWLNLPQPLPSDSAKYASYIDGYNKTNDTITIITAESRSFTNAYVTLQYTKNTD